MDLVSRKYFARLCEIPEKTGSQYVGTYIKRGLIKELFDENGKRLGIDVDDPVHKKFIRDKIREKKDKLSIASSTVHDKVVEIEKPVAKKKPVIKNRNIVSVEVSKKISDSKKKVEEIAEKSSKESDIMFGLEARKKQAEVLKLEREAEKVLLQLHKMNGEMLPTDFVKQMMVGLVKTIVSVFDNELDNLAGVFCDELAGGSRDHLSRVNQKLDEEFQRVVDGANKIAKNQMIVAIKEYSIKKGKGERE